MRLLTFNKTRNSNVRSLFALFLIFNLLTLFSCEEKGKKTKVEQLSGASLDSLLKIYPDSIPFLVQRGKERIELYLFEDAVADAAKAFRLDSSRTESRLLFAEALINKPKMLAEDLFRAHGIFKKLVKEQPNNKEALLGLANTYSMFEDYDNSFVYINKALRVDKKYRNAYVLKGTNYRKMGNFKLAVSSYETAVQQDPEFYGGYLMLGALYQAKEDPICMEYYTTAYKLQPKNPDVLYSLAYAKQIFSKEEDAKRLYRRMIRIDSTYHEAYFQIGFIHQFSALNIDSAMFYYDKAIEIAPNHLESLHNIGLIYEDKKDYSNALLTYAKVLKINPEYTLSRERADALKKLR
jgi:tetratricopeptide (TPR) repeat protein